MHNTENVVQASEAVHHFIATALSSFRRTSRRNETELSKHIWTLKDAKKSFHVQWKVLKKCKPYDNVSKKCNLCLQEGIYAP